MTLNQHGSARNIHRRTYDSLVNTLPAASPNVRDAAGINSVTVTAPCMIAIVDNAKVQASSVAEAMKDVLELIGVRSLAVTSRPAHGAAIIQE